MRYKNISFLFLSVLSLLPPPAKAQETTHERKFCLGFATSFQLAKIDRFGTYQPWSTQGDWQETTRSTGAIGIMVGYTPLQWLRIQIESNFAGYGGAFKTPAGVSITGPGAVHTGPSGTSSYSNTPQQGYYKDIYRMNFLEFPLLARGYLPTSFFMRPYVELGMSYGLLLGSSLRYNSFSGTVQNTTEDWETTDLKGLPNKYFVNYILGAGLDFRCSRKFSIGLQLRFNSSLTRVFKEEYYDMTDSQGFIERFDLVTHYHAFRIGVQCAWHL